MDSRDRPTLQRSLSTSSVESLLPPPTPYKKFIIGMIATLSLITVCQLFLCCIYSDISGHASHWYEKPHSWPFCLVYTDQTVQRYDQKLLDSTPSQLAYIGLMNALYTWVALAVTFRALYHFEWIPSTFAFIVFNVFGQLCYYQSNNLVVVPPKLVSSLVSLTAWFSFDMYDHMGKFCYDAGYLVETPFSDDPERTSLFQDPMPNCTSSVVILTTEISETSDTSAKLNLMANSTVLNSRMDCDGAVTLNFVFILLNYLLIGITVILGIVLAIADFQLRQKRPERHYFKETGENLVGSRRAQILVTLASLGYVITSVANCDAAIVALDCVKKWRVIDMVSSMVLEKDFDIGTIAASATITVDYDVTFDTKAYFPFKINQLDLQTVLLIITVMSVIRGSFKQSTSAFRLAGVTSLLAIIVQWPPIVGNMQTFDSEHLWWWDSSNKCRDYHSGKAYFYPDHEQSMRYCWDTRMSILGALITFVALHFNIIMCFYVFQTNLYRKSLAIDLFEFDDDGLEDHHVVNGFVLDDDDGSRDQQSSLTGRLLDTESEIHLNQPTPVQSKGKSPPRHIPGAIAPPPGFVYFHFF